METSSPQPDIATAPHSTSVPASRPVSPPSSFAEMHLKVGDKIPIETSHSRETKSKRLLAKIVGWSEGSSLLVSLSPQTIHAGLIKDNEQVLLRAFTGRTAFAFSTTVLKIEHFPFTYLHLSFPKKVEAVEVRSSFRHGVRLPATITTDGKADVTGDILDVGMTGVRVGTIEPLQDETPIRLVTQFELHEVPVSLELHAQVRSSKNVPDEHGTARYEYGMEFQNLQPNDRLILGSLLWYQMQMHPERTA
ncbi:MAG: flagellar brake protein [Nitrosomonadales bacterium]|nr:MAG: flagellar brake protein [Nitrosomonadales bacterium]